MILQPYQCDALKAQFDRAVPFRHIVIDDFLEPDFALKVAQAFPTFERAVEQGFAFDFVNERKKVQISDSSAFPEPIARLNKVLASSEFLSDLESITGIRGLMADEVLLGGGMHVTGPHGRLDVHLDFNYSEEQAWHRRLNILIYLNPDWDEGWGGEVELWDHDVKQCHHRIAPILNRCVIFETSDISFHGVRPLECPPDTVRKSFAAYYYTKDAPPGWDGEVFSTVFRARPGEWLSGYLLAPAERLRRRIRPLLRRLKERIVPGRRRD